MSTYTPPYQLTDAILRLSTEIAATVKEITVRGNLTDDQLYQKITDALPVLQAGGEQA